MPDDSRWNFTDFEDYLRSRGLSNRTTYEYLKQLRKLLRWCHQHRLDPELLTPRQVAQWAQTLPPSRESRKQAHTAMKHFAAWRGLPDGYHLAVPVPRKPKRTTRALSDVDAATARDAALLVGGRPGMAVILGLYTAARPGEIGGMRWDGWADGWLRWWRSKVSDWHGVPVHPFLAEQLQRFRDDTGAHSAYLFPGAAGRPHVGAGTIWDWVRQVSETAGVAFRPQQLRATALTIVNDATDNLRAAQEFAGHSDPEVTAGYTRATDRMLADAASSFDIYDGGRNGSPAEDGGRDGSPAEDAGRDGSRVEDAVAPPAATTDEHQLEIVAVYTNYDRFDAKRADGRCCHRLERNGAVELLPDSCYGECSCGARGDTVDGWQEARWWCRHHRDELGLPRQPLLPERVIHV